LSGARGGGGVEEVAVGVVDEGAKDDATSFVIEVVGASPDGTNEYDLEVTGDVPSCALPALRRRRTSRNGANSPSCRRAIIVTSARPLRPVADEHATHVSDLLKCPASSVSLAVYVIRQT
jgi:hypothetical protein